MKILMFCLIFILFVNVQNTCSQPDSIGNEFIWVQPYGVMVRSDQINDKVSLSIGKIFVAADKIERFEYSENRNRIVMRDALFNFAVSEYEKNIKPLSVEDRVDYLWSVIWRLDLGESSYFQLEQIISKDCPDLFLKKLDKFIKYENDKNKLGLAKAFKKHIEYLVKDKAPNMD